MNVLSLTMMWLTLSVGSSFSTANMERELSCSIAQIDDVSPSITEHAKSAFDRGWYFFEYPTYTLSISARTIDLAAGTPLIEGLPAPKNTKSWLSKMLVNDRNHLKEQMFMLTDVFTEEGAGIEGLEGQFYAANVSMEYDESIKEITALWAATKHHQIHFIRFFFRPNEGTDLIAGEQARKAALQGIQQCKLE